MTRETLQKRVHFFDEESNLLECTYREYLLKYGSEGLELPSGTEDEKRLMEIFGRYQDNVINNSYDKYPFYFTLPVSKEQYDKYKEWVINFLHLKLNDVNSATYKDFLAGDENLRDYFHGMVKILDYEWDTTEEITFTDKYKNL